VATGVAAVRGAALVHARSDLAAASTLLAGVGSWVWDVRSLWADQRIALEALRAGGPEHRVLQRVEGSAARRSGALVTLTAAVVPVLAQRHGVDLAGKATVIPTCVDLRRFAPAPMPSRSPVRLLLAGTLNRYYDVPLMARFVSVGQRRRPTTLQLLAPARTSWETLLASVGTTFGSATSAEMPSRLAAHHAGLSVCRADAGLSLTAAMPTKIAEFLAVGRPVVVNRGLGDADLLVEQAGAGVVLDDATDAGLVRAWDQLDALLEDAGTPERCRSLAETHFDLDQGVSRLLEVYARCDS
jgi:glycosyltransferase involved in cell wall biosynthesis